MQDMQAEDVNGEYREETLEYQDGSQRKVLISDVEIAYPEGRLIVSSTDQNGIINHVNKSFVDMSGFTEDELIGQPHCILRHPDMPPAAFKDLWDTVQAGNRWQGYVKNLRKDGAYYWVYATVIANIRNGEVKGYTSVRRKPSRKKVQECIDLYPTLF
ncbi:MAG: PAS domain S-box protein [Methylococcaceae bacterium]|nr:PAS domain S-box protein [Methylococcaceae bacterium]